MAEIIRIEKPASGGSLTIDIREGDALVNSLGHLGAVPTHAILGTLDYAFENAGSGIARHIADRWSDIPWRGDLLVRVGHSSLWGDIERTFRTNIKGRPNFFLRVLALPGTFFGWLATKLRRVDHYNPYTKTVHIFHRHPAVGMHETGHAAFYDQTRHQNLWALANLVPFYTDKFLLPWPFLTFPVVTSFQEWKATQGALRQMKSDTERREALKVLEPAFGTYLPTDVLSLAAPFIPGGFAWMLAAPLAGAIAGHIVNRTGWQGVKGRKERFGYVFEGNRVP